jgi:aryl-phospho-beta-D-glucosidase BglC (GH1 family)
MNHSILQFNHIHALHSVLHNLISTSALKMTFTFLSLSLVATYLTVAYASTGYLDWTTFNGNGVNLGGWLEQESTIDTEWWAQYSGGEADEWGLCAYQGSQCGPVLERRYAIWITTADIDEPVEAGISILRIPTTYAAWVKVPGSQLYSGNQVSFLNSISSYAVSKHSMHIIIDVHSLPGGVNGMPFGEAEGHYGWFNNQTALNYSLQVIDAVISFVQNSGFPQAFTIEPINEPVDNTDITAFGTPAALSESGASWVLKYVQEIIAKVQATNPKIPVMF